MPVKKRDQPRCQDKQGDLSGKLIEPAGERCDKRLLCLAFLSEANDSIDVGVYMGMVNARGGTTRA